MPDSNRTNQLKEAIRVHLNAVGPKNWKMVSTAFSDISDATFWRYVKAAREQLAAEAPADPPNPTQIATSQEAEPSRSKLHPGNLGSYFKDLRRAERYQGLLEDAENLKRQALDKQGRIINLQMYERGIRLSERLLLGQQDALERFMNAEHNAQFYDTMIDVIAAESRPVCIKLMNALNAIPH